MKAAHLIRTTMAAAGCAGSVVACSVLLDWSDFTSEDGGGGSSDGGTIVAEAGTEGGDGHSADDGDSGSESDAAPLTPCGPDMLCAPPVPSVPGWEGPYTLFNGAPNTASPCDPSSYEMTPVFTGYEGLTAPSPACACTCSAPQGTTCSTPQVTFYADAPCTMPCGDSYSLTGCVAAPTTIGGVTCASFIVGGSTATGGACAAAPPPPIAPVAWASEAQACKPQAPAQGSCGAGEFCLSEGSGNFCIMQAGMVACPAGSYSANYVYFGGASDTRGCAACSCGSPSGGSCTFSTGSSFGFPFLDTKCTLPTGAFSPIANACVAIPTAKAVQGVMQTPTLDAGGCAPSEGAAVGAAAPSDPTTFCCTR